jgi:hypothetical protein
MNRLILTPLIAFAVPVALAWLGLTNLLGAHIWWDVKTILIGAPIGLVLAFLLAEKWDARVKRTAVWVFLLIAAFVVAKYGQTAFANSYAEDQVAGKLWYFGWIATGAGAAGTIYSAIKP